MTQRPRVSLLEGDEFMRFWPDIAQMMDSCPETWEQFTTKEAVEEGALQGYLQVWGIGDEEEIRMVAITQVAVFPSTRVLQIVWAAGRGKVFDFAGDVVEYTLDYFAKTQRCSRIDAIGREGWIGPLKKHGFKKASVIMSRPVVHKGVQ